MENRRGGDFSKRTEAKTDTQLTSFEVAHFGFGGATFFQSRGN
ncbi:MAG: hypothetical protein ACI87E_001753 [Mariniblastus sp.]|jgi:hypothetical protein